jgi:ATP-dependent Lhr-like helicase
VALDVFHPIVRTWFERRFGQPTEAQASGWKQIASGQDTLIMAPTGSGKTLAAFLYGLDSVVRRALDGRLDERVRIIYVSPLKALGADVDRNLQAPLRGIEDTAVQLGRLLPPIKTALRTGDTTQAERARILRHPPHVLITTPESLYLMITSDGGRGILDSAETVILDEIHALVGNKRGAHLALTLERLDALCGKRLQRVGLSATVEPPAEAARFLTGHDERGRPRPCHLVDAGRTRPLDLAIEVPRETLGAVASRTAWGDVYTRLEALFAEHRTTLVFVPSRRLAERVAHDLEARLGKNVVAAHHGALAKRTRLSVERKLQKGELKAVVATASLELGIDIGDVELVCQLGSPRSISVLRQRIGRAGHAVGGTPKGRIFALTRDELVECAAAVRAIRAGRIDKPVLRDRPLDILSQQLVATCSTPSMSGLDSWPEDDLFALARRAGPYSELPRAEFDQVLAMLADGIATRRGRSGAHLHFDRVNRRVRGRRGARLAALTSGGAIPDKADYQVVEDTTEQMVGTLDEDFAIESMVGDIFQLGTTSWRVRRVENGRVRVEDAHGLPPSIPFWNGEGLARTEELSAEVAALREELHTRAVADRDGAIAWLESTCAVEPVGAVQAVDYVLEAAQALGAIPTQRTVVAERFFDDSGGMQLVIHAPFGARINRAWGLGLRKKFCRTFDFELQAAATDDAILLSIGPQHSFPLDAIFGFLHANTVEPTLTQAALQAPMWETRWRWNATRALAVLRSQGGKRTPPPLLRMRAADLAAAVFPEQAGCQDNHGGVMREDMELPDHPLVNETKRDCLEEAMDVRGLERVLESIDDGRVQTLARDTVGASPFAHGILNANPYAYLDDAPLEERRTRAVSTSRPGELLAKDKDLLTLDATAIRAVVDEVQPDPRDPDELHDLLCTMTVVAPRPAWTPWYESLRAAGRAAVLVSDGRAPMWVPAERIDVALAAFPAARVEPALPPLPPIRAWDVSSAAKAIVGAHVQTAGPITAAALVAQLGLERSAVDEALARLEADGLVLQGRFTSKRADAPNTTIEWCDRRILQRIHRRTIGQLREQVKPVPPAELIRFLLRWQHVQPGTRLHGPEGVLKVIEQLEGLELPAAAWEREVLPARIENYQPQWLDELCLSGEVTWARLRVEAPEPEDADRPRGATGRLGLFLRAHAGWLVQRDGESPTAWGHLTPLAKRVAAELERRGAAFAADLAAAVGEPLGAVDDALWELVRTGAVNADGFAGLRALLAPRDGRPRRGLAGRWSLLHRDAPLRGDDAGEFGDGSPVEHARLYLRRYGVVVRALVDPRVGRETAAPPWRELVQVYRRLEARGEIRGGRFVTGLSGEQFALPEALEALRARRRSPDAEDVQVAATDPLNLVGILTPGPRVPAVSGHAVVYRDGAPLTQLRSLA